MLEIKDDKVKLWYRFDSNYVDEGYEKYDLDEFCYKVELDDVKDTICFELCKVVESEHPLSVLNALNELDSWECIDWNNIIVKCEDLLEDYYRMDAMKYFVDKHDE